MNLFKKFTVTGVCLMALATPALAQCGDPCCSECGGDAGYYQQGYYQQEVDAETMQALYLLMMMAEQYESQGYYQNQAVDCPECNQGQVDYRPPVSSYPSQTYPAASSNKVPLKHTTNGGQPRAQRTQSGGFGGHR